MIRQNELTETLKKYASLMENPQTWTDVLSALADYETQKMQDISRSIEQQYFLNRKKHWEIQTGLMDMWDKTKTTTLPEGLHFVSSVDESPFYAYLDCPYEELNAWYQKEFQGCYQSLEKRIISFSYQLVPEMELLEAEEELNRFAKFNDIDVPLIYSPYFRRLVRIDINAEMSEKEAETIDLQLENYPELKSILRLNHRAVWNVHFKEATASDRMETYQRTPFRYCHYYHTNSNEYIHFETPNPSDFDILRTDRQIEIYTNYERLENVNLLEITPLAILSKGISWSFCHFDNLIPVPPRIRTKSDIFDIIGRFRFENETPLRLSEILTTETGGNDTFCEYHRSEMYPEYQDLFKNSRPSSGQNARIIRLIFEKDDSNFFYDKVVMVIHSLNQHYPEFCWKGGYQQ